MSIEGQVPMHYIGGSKDNEWKRLDPRCYQWNVPVPPRGCGAYFSPEVRDPVALNLKVDTYYVHELRMTGSVHSAWFLIHDSIEAGRRNEAAWLRLVTLALESMRESAACAGGGGK